MKTIFLIILIIASGLTVKSQSVFSLGPKVGYNSYSLTDNMDSVKSSIQNSFQIGAFIRVGSKVYFQPEANYQVEKSTVDKSIGLSILSQDVTLKSIKIPALIGVKLINGSVFNLRIFAGPAFNYILEKKINPAALSELWPIYSVDDLKNSTWSVQMGAGMDVLFLTLDVRYEMGIDNTYSGNSDLNMKNNMFNVSLGLKLF
ncbi:MAG: porin family protein [Lentimicrobiaceae bacterium]|jgi:hypothetical protein